MMNRIERILITAVVGFYTAAWHLFLGAGKWTHAIVDAIGAAWTWWREAFGTSDVLESPDFSALAARAAGHWSVGAGSTLFVWGLGAALWAASPALAILYGAWELWQRAVDPAKHQRRVARRWDMAVDWAAVQMGGACVIAALLGYGQLTSFFVVISVALILRSAWLMAKRSVL